MDLRKLNLLLAQGPWWLPRRQADSVVSIVIAITVGALVDSNTFASLIGVAGTIEDPSPVVATLVEVLRVQKLPAPQ